MRIGLIFGTRPEAIKIAPIYLKLKEMNQDTLVIITAQHREILDQVLQLFQIKPNYDLNVMSESQTLPILSQKLIYELDNLLQKEPIDYILVQGDTTTAFIGALISFYYKIPVAHIEAGLRTNDRYNPFPEEINRRLISVIASLHFAPTQRAKENLMKEGINETLIKVTGNTVVDALHWIIDNKKDNMHQTRVKYDLDNKRYILMTMHRRENWGEPMINVLKAVRRYLSENPDMYLVFPIHPNPIVKNIVYDNLQDLENAILLEPLEYFELISLMDGCIYIMTDSGGIQEEAPSFGKPVLILRDKTERPEILETNLAKLVGTNTQTVYEYMKKFENYKLENVNFQNPFGDGKASQRITEYLIEALYSTK